MAGASVTDLDLRKGKTSGSEIMVDSIHLMTVILVHWINMYRKTATLPQETKNVNAGHDQIVSTARRQLHREIL